jgi:hypothetical protein
MKRILYFFITALLFSLSSAAQKNEKTYQFHSIFNLALLNGTDEVNGSLQTVNGFQKGNWFAGVGTGIDYYIFRTIPVFADLRYQFGKKKSKFFVYADGGININWTEKYNYNNPVIFIWEEDENRGSRFADGIFTDIGFGYNLHLGKAGGLVVSLGNSHKSLKQTVTYTDWRSQEIFTDLYEYKLNRVSVKLGWQF